MAFTTHDYEKLQQLMNESPENKALLQKLLDSQQYTISKISHEIRNPLAVISNATRLLKLLVSSPSPKAVKQFGIIEEEIKQANSIISEVLGYARTRELMLNTRSFRGNVMEYFVSERFHGLRNHAVKFPP